MTLYGESRDIAKIIGILLILTAIVLLSKAKSPENTTKGE